MRHSPRNTLSGVYSNAVAVVAIVAVILATAFAAPDARGGVAREDDGMIEPAPRHSPSSPAPAGQASPQRLSTTGMTCSQMIGAGIDFMEEGRLDEARDLFSEAAGSRRCSVIGRQVAQTHEHYALFFLREKMDPLDQVRTTLLKTGTDNISRRAMDVYRNLYLEHEFKTLTAGPWLEVKEFLFKKNFGILRIRGEALSPGMEKRLDGLSKTFHTLLKAEEPLNSPGMTLARVKTTNHFLEEAARRIEALSTSDTATARLEGARIADRRLPFEEAIRKYNGLVEPFMTDPTRWAEAQENLARERSDWMDDLPEELGREYEDLLAGFEKVEAAERMTDPFLKLEHYQNARPEAGREPTLSAFVERRIDELQARIDIAGRMYRKLVEALAEHDEQKARNALNGLEDAFMIYLRDPGPRHARDLKSIIKDIDEGDALMGAPDLSDRQMEEARRLYESARSKSTALEEVHGEIQIAWLPKRRLVKKHRLAIFPWRMNADVSIFRPLVLNTIVDFFENARESRFIVKSSWYEIENPGGRRTIDAIEVDDQDRDLLWESISRAEGEPLPARIDKLGRELNVDAILMVDFRIREKGVYVGAEVLRLYLIDVESHTVYYVKNRARIAAYMGDLKNELVVLLDELMRQYSASSEGVDVGERP